jgi:hypothetical protein
LFSEQKVVTLKKRNNAVQKRERECRRADKKVKENKKGKLKIETPWNEGEEERRRVKKKQEEEKKEEKEERKDGKERRVEKRKGREPCG